MILMGNTSLKTEHSKRDYFFHIAFAVLLCLYSFLILFSSRLLGIIFFSCGLALLGFTVWRGIRRVLSLIGVLVVLCLLFFSRIVWMDAFQVLPVTFYDIFQIVFFIEFSIGILLLYSLTVKSAPLSNSKMTHVVHVAYFLTGILLVPYTWLCSYGAVIQREFNGLFWAALTLCMWSCLYYVQLTAHKNRIMQIALYSANVGVGCWALYRWMTIFS
ncbi:hypothetical protein KUV80_15710 [Fictibacillus nanhaiensis]|uniref:hypothetical protein n=1 Tax=Fictibacillus nanhaiensis TaxID=742169 RepID=UPI001C95D953|nr:hypothetical protein [Fictibacillus nanhaiensis]MBY6038105.1 hypothetical protein [Fictibacillus nanhaiensis]